jgi:serine/threonine protein kinase
MWSLYCNNVPYTHDKDGAFKWNPDFPHFPPSALVAFVTLVHRCLRKDPASRPTAAEVLQILKELRGVSGKV